jgi:hypothetical protein
MPTIKFIDVTFHEGDASDVEERLKEFLRSCRRKKLAETDLPEAEAGLEPMQDEFGEDDLPTIMLSYNDTKKIRRRVATLVQRRMTASGTAHLRPEEIKRLAVLRAGANLTPPGNEAWADEVAAALHAEMPWMAPATETAWYALRRSAQRRDPGLRLPPLLLNGPAGIGKSVWARRLAEMCAVPSCVIEVGSGSANFRVSGLERGWSSAAPGRPLETILQTRIANPIIIVDEVCKMQSVTSEKGQAYSMADSMLALLEPATNKAWECPCFRIKFDMSHISWVLTANNAERVPLPLLNRCTIIDLPPVCLQDLCTFARAETARRGLSEASTEAIVLALCHPVARTKYLSLRSVIRMIERAEVLEGRPRLQ